MKHLLLVAAVLFSLNLQAQRFTQIISLPFCDTFDLLTIEIISNQAPLDGNLDSITIFFEKQSTRTGLKLYGNKKIKNDTALINPLKRKIIQGASQPVGVVPPIKEPAKANRFVSIKGKQND